jgi:hypothetical protein
MRLWLIWIAFVLLAIAGIDGLIHSWNKPYNFEIVASLPWHFWVLWCGGAVLVLGQQWLDWIIVL